MPRAVNPETGEVLFLVDDQWVPPLQTAKNESGEAAYLVNNQWVLPGKDYVGAPTGTSNPFMGAVGRAAEIAGSGVEAVARMGEKAGDALETALPLSNLSPEEIKNKRQLEPMFQFADKLKNVSKDIGYSPTTKLSDLGDNPLTVIPFVAERIISSSPDMAAAVAASPAYITSLTNEILNDRLTNDKKTLADATVKDVSLALASAFAQGKFEKYATKHLISGKAVGATAAGRIGKETALQFGTEGVEEGIDYLGRTVDTKKGVDTNELLASMAEGAITGGGLGITGQGARELLTRNRVREADTEKKVIDTLSQEEAKTAPPTVPPLSETQAYDQMMREVDTGVAMQPLQPTIPAETAPKPEYYAGTLSPATGTPGAPIIDPSTGAEVYPNDPRFAEVSRYKGIQTQAPVAPTQPAEVVNPFQAELSDLYKQRDQLVKTKDNLNVWLRKVGISTKDRADMGIESNSKDYPFVFKNDAQRLDVLMHDAIENGIITEADLSAYPDPVEAFRQMAKDAIDGATADTPQNMANKAQLEAIQSRIEHLSSIPKEEYAAYAQAAAEPKTETTEPTYQEIGIPEFVAPETATPVGPVTPGEYAYREPVTPSTNLSEEGEAMFSRGTAEQQQAVEAVVEKHRTLFPYAEAVYQNGDLSLVKTVDPRTGDFIYAPAKKDRFPTYPRDIASAEGKKQLSALGLSQAEQADLIAQRDKFEAAEQAKHDKTPFLKIGQGVTASADVNRNILAVSKSWANLLGIKKNVYITTVEDAVKNRENYTGPHRVIGTLGVRGSNGVMKQMDDGNYVVVLQKSSSMSKNLETIAHEFGHIHEKEVYDTASPETKEAIQKAFREWRSKLSSKTPAKELVESLRAKTSAQTTTGVDGLLAGQMKDVDAYWTSFREWYADQVSRWAVSSDKPLTVVDKFFAKLAVALRKFYNTVKGQKYLPNETFKQYLDEIASRMQFESFAEAKAPKGQMALFSKETAEPSDWISREDFAKYKNAPKTLMGFGKNAPLKGFDKENYKHYEYLQIQLPDGETFYDALRGLNKTHVLARAFRNWDADAIRTVSKEEAFKNDPQLVKSTEISMRGKKAMEDKGIFPLASEMSDQQLREEIRRNNLNLPSAEFSRSEVEAEGPSGIKKLNKIRRNYRGEIVSPETVWSIPDDSKMERFIYKIQDKFIDTKRVVQAIRTQIADITDKWDAYLKEELYHGRTAKRTKDFLQNELLPLVQKMRNNKISVIEFDTYLHARHAKERNEQIAKINPEFLKDGSPNPNAMPDGGSGMFTKDAEAYMAKLDPKKKQILEDLANKVDSIVKDTQNILVKSGLESQDTIDIWNKTYEHYVPLMRKDLDFAQEFTGLGQGFQVKGGASKRAFGSFKEVADIFANIADQRERAIVRSEKARVGNALYGLAIMNPNSDFWLPVNPDAIKDPEKLVAELEKMGIDPSQAKNLIEEPQVADIDKETGTVVYKVNPILRNSSNVFSVRIGGQQRYIFFNPSNERAMRMVEAVKNLDAEEMGWALGNAAKVTRWIASVNTQYNPVFGAYNFIRDTLGAQFNLSTTPLAGMQARVTAGVLPALRGIYKDLRSQRAGEGAAEGEWAKLWEEYQQEGGATGYRDQFSKNREEQSVIEREMANLEKGNVKKGVAAVFNWLSDYNDAMENAVRLSAYKVAIDKGLTKERAASLAKNLTVNFNRKGERAQQLGALYAFFNASVQGTARLAETLQGPAGKKIIGGGLLLGSVQALSLAMMGFKDDEPSEFIKERNLVIPFPDGHYIAIPMPLGLHIIPNIGRITTEMVMNGGKDAGKKVANLTGVLMDSFNPIGNAGLSMQSLSPTMLDPIAAIIENKDTFGRPIAREDRATNPTPGYTRTRETASYLGKELSYFLNIASGGTKYQKGLISPTPDQIDFLAGQATGGVGREISKAEQAVTAAVTGEELPSYKVPLVGKFYGNVTSQAAQANRFYDNITKMANYENEIKGRQKDRVSTADFMAEHPEARLYQRANQLENEISKLNREKKDLVEKGADKSRIKTIEDRKTRIMTQFNNQVENLEK